MPENLRMVSPGEVPRFDFSRMSDPEAIMQYNNLFSIGPGYRTPYQDSLLKIYEQELRKRNLPVKEDPNVQIRQDILNTLGGGGQGGPGTGMDNFPAPQFDIGAITSQEQQALGDEQKQLQQIFSQQLGLGSQAIQDQFAPIRARQIAERAALGPGVLASPASIPGIYNIDVQQGRALSDLISKLGISQAEQQVGLDTESARRLQQARQFGANLGLGVRGQNLTARGQDISRQEALARLLSGQGQFGQEQELRERQFGQQERQFDVEMEQQREAENFARQLGALQAKAQQPSDLSQALGIVGGIGSLAGGIGLLRGGFGALRGGSALVGAGQLAGGASQLGNQFSGFGGPHDTMSIRGSTPDYQNNLSPYYLRESTAFNPYTLYRKPYSFPYSKGRQSGWQTGGDYDYS